MADASPFASETSMNLTVTGIDVAINHNRILSEVSLRAPSGSCVGIIGPNGSGKSTLLRSIYRALPPNAGEILLNEHDVWQISPRQSALYTAAVVQESPTDIAFTVHEIVSLGRIPHLGRFGQATPHDQQIVTDAMTRVDVMHLASRLFHTLSGGEKQRVLVARALAQQPQLLILDEPTNHLDIHHQLELLALVRTLGITILTTLHDLNLAAQYCDYLYLIHQGQIVADGTPPAVLTVTNIRQFFHVDVDIQSHPRTGTIQLIFSPYTE
jgi:iron complex transport system ATP-binding protein